MTNRKRYWSRRPGKFVDSMTGEEQPWPVFRGTVQDWYSTLQTVIWSECGCLGFTKDCTVLVGPAIRCILESSPWYNVIAYESSNILEHVGAIGPINDIIVKFIHESIEIKDRTCVIVCGDKTSEIEIIDMSV